MNNEKKHSTEKKIGQVRGGLSSWTFSLDEKPRSTGLVLSHIKEPNIAKIIVLKEEVLIRRKVEGREQIGGGIRGNIKGLSVSARRRLLLQARNIDGMIVEATLTYPAEFPLDGLKVKRDLKAILRWLRKQDIKGMWFLEFQERGAPHFHCFLSGFMEKRELSAAWYRIVHSGDKRHLKAGTRISYIRKAHALAAYAAKYAAKWGQKEVPSEYKNVGRFWGRFGGLKVIGKVVAEGTISQVAPITRLVRHHYIANRRNWSSKPSSINKKFKRFRDNGRYSFTAWGGARLFERVRIITEGGVIYDGNEITI